MLHALHAMRAVAALMVFASHYEQAVFRRELIAGTMDSGTFHYGFFLRAGTFGVALFFLISGFIMVYTSRREGLSAGQFAVKRVLRIFPVYWVCLLLHGVLVASPDFMSTVAGSSVLLPLQNSAPPGYGFSTLAMAWTLTYEMVFYAYFALAIRLGRSRPGTGFVVFVLLAVGVLALQLSFAGQPTLDPQASPIIGGEGRLAALASLLANPLLLLFGLGALVGEGFMAWSDYPRRHPARRIAPWFGLAMLLASPLLYFLMPPQHGLFGSATPALAIFLAAVSADLSDIRIDSAMVHALGHWSYAIYLIHIPVIQSVERFAPDFWARHYNILAVAGLTLAVLGVAAALHRWVERPGIRLGKRLAKIGSGPPPSPDGGTVRA
ncbi:MAG: acyltransferase [Sulfurisoma sp.]|nr:acyltransferase [Sulfurisoma sp.]